MATETAGRIRFPTHPAKRPLAQDATSPQRGNGKVLRRDAESMIHAESELGGEHGDAPLEQAPLGNASLTEPNTPNAPPIDIDVYIASLRAKIKGPYLKADYVPPPMTEERKKLADEYLRDDDRVSTIPDPKEWIAMAKGLGMRTGR